MSITSEHIMRIAIQQWRRMPAQPDTQHEVFFHALAMAAINSDLELYRDMSLLADLAGFQRETLKGNRYA